MLRTLLTELRKPIAPPWHPWGNVSTGVYVLVALFVFLPLYALVGLISLVRWMR